MPADKTDVGLCVALADIARRDLLAAVAQSPRIRKLFMESLVADMAALSAADVADSHAERKVLAFPGGDAEIGEGR